MINYAQLLESFWANAIQHSSYYCGRTQRDFAISVVILSWLEFWTNRLYAPSNNFVRLMKIIYNSTFFFLQFSYNHWLKTHVSYWSTWRKSTRWIQIYTFCKLLQSNEYNTYKDVTKNTKEEDSWIHVSLPSANAGRKLSSRNAKIITLYKNKGEPSDCNSYRCIFLLWGILAFLHN